MIKKKILVCGTGFGKIYLKAIVESEEFELAGILGRGSERTKLLTKTLDVPLFTDISNLPNDIDAACVVIPNAAGGGNGIEITEKLLSKGIPTLLEHPAHKQEIIRGLRASKDVSFMINPFYRYISSIQDFIYTACIIGEQSKLINASLECAIHVLYDGIDILGCTLGNLSKWTLGTATEVTSEKDFKGVKSVKGIIGEIPVMFTINTDVDKNDLDHPLHLYHRIELTFSTGKICLVNTHGPVIWMPFQYMPRDQFGSMDTSISEINIPSAVVIGNQSSPTVKDTFEEVWPAAAKKALKVLLEQDKKQKMTMAQYQIYVSKLWSELTKKIGYINLVDYENKGDNGKIYYTLKNKGLIKGDEKIV